jgi:hypothetical protein
MKNTLRFTSIIFLLILASLACSVLDSSGSSGGGSTSLPAGVLFQDDFSDSSSGWDQINMEEGITDYESGYSSFAQF